MPSIYDLKPRFQGLLRPTLRPLARVGLTANALTLLAALGSVGTGLGLWIDGALVLPLVPVWLFLRMALNALDGMMAREFGMRSHLGAILNEVGDVVSDLALYLPLAFLEPPAAAAVVAFASGAALTEFCGVLAQALGAGRQYQGPMGKSDRAFLVGLLALLGTLWPGTRGYWPWVFALGALLAAWTAWRRSAAALERLSGDPGLGRA
jgi:phosphatidylglycerophosphate synthase